MNPTKSETPRPLLVVIDVPTVEVVMAFAPKAAESASSMTLKVLVLVLMSVYPGTFFSKTTGTKLKGSLTSLLR